ncbi:MAG: undecaprenyl/decaprenyl-phosphate alpha-N-acetylglucosaminyl 1-phosphate transferase, partial [Gemmatimonadetes bacterium]
MSLTVMSILFPAFAAVATVALTPLARTLALRRGRVSDPREDRWHRRPTPAVGGAPLFIGFGGAVALAIAFGAHPAGWMDPPARAVLPLAPHMAILLAATGMFLLGLVDDQVQVRPVTKLVGQIAAAALLITSGIGVWLTGVYVVDVAISLLWFVGVTNALNLLDNMDGLAGGVGAIAAGFMGVTFGLEGQAELAVIAFSLMGALIGFLVHNYPPARVFMGDSGSLFLGVTLAGMALAPAPGLSRGLV